MKLESLSYSVLSSNKYQCITDYSVTNFKLLNLKSDINIRPFTFLFGPNGSGKSTLIKSLQFFKNILEEDLSDSSFIGKPIIRDICNKSTNAEDISFSFHITPRHLNLDAIGIPWKSALGNSNIISLTTGQMAFRSELIHSSSQIVLNLSFNISTTALRIEDTITGFILDIVLKEGKIINDIKKFSLGKLKIDNEQLIDTEDIQLFELLEKIGNYSPVKQKAFERIISRFLSYSSIKLPFMQFPVEEYQDESFMINRDINVSKKELRELINDLNSIGVNTEVYDDIHSLLWSIQEVANIIISPYFFIINATIRDFFKNMHFITPYGKNISTINSFESIQDINVSDLRKLISEQNKALYYQKKSKIKNNSNDIMKHSFYFYSRLKEALFSIFGIDSINITLSSENYVIDFSESGISYSISNGSSGLKHLFPILLKVAAAKESVISIQQPELHLHPKLQSRFVEHIGRNRMGNYYLIETHSEHIIKKIQVLVAKGTIQHNDVGIYFFNKKDNNAEIAELRIDKHGQILDVWPDGFFDESYILTKELLMSSNN